MCRKESKQNLDDWKEKKTNKCVYLLDDLPIFSSSAPLPLQRALSSPPFPPLSPSHSLSATKGRLSLLLKHEHTFESKRQQMTTAAASAAAVAIAGGGVAPNGVASAAIPAASAPPAVQVIEDSDEDDGAAQPPKLYPVRFGGGNSKTRNRKSSMGHRRRSLSLSLPPKTSALSVSFTILVRVSRLA